MRYKDAITFIVAAILGCMGGLTAVWLGPRDYMNVDPHVLRTSRVELTDSSGIVRSVLGISPNNAEVALTFLAPNGTVVNSLGVDSELPFVRFWGQDGRMRVVLHLSQAQNPRLVFGDGKQESRVILGAIEGDDVSQNVSRSVDWALQFKDSSITPAASVGMVHHKEGAYSGTVQFRK